MKKSQKRRATPVRKRAATEEPGLAKQQIDSNVKELEWLEEKRPKDNRRKP